MKIAGIIDTDYIDSIRQASSAAEPIIKKGEVDDNSCSLVEKSSAMSVSTSKNQFVAPKKTSNMEPIYAVVGEVPADDSGNRIYDAVIFEVIVISKGENNQVGENRKFPRSLHLESG